jgi:hypothetical protein
VDEGNGSYRTFFSSVRKSPCRIWLLCRGRPGCGVFRTSLKGGLGVPKEGEGGEDEDVWNRWRSWLNAIQSRKSVQETTSEKEYYLPIYKRYADNVAQSELAKATRAGRGVP